MDRCSARSHQGRLVLELIFSLHNSRKGLSKQVQSTFKGQAVELINRAVLGNGKALLRNNVSTINAGFQPMNSRPKHLVPVDQRERELVAAAVLWKRSHVIIDRDPFGLGDMERL